MVRSWNASWVARRSCSDIFSELSLADYLAKVEEGGKGREGEELSSGSEGSSSCILSTNRYFHTRYKLTAQSLLLGASMRSALVVSVLLLVVGAQGALEEALDLPWPTRPLEWKDVNFLSTSDTHGTSFLLVLLPVVTDGL